MPKISHQESFLHPHDYLLAVVISLTQSVIYGISAPLGADGTLKEKMGYIFHFSDMDEIQTRGLSLPDGLVLNREKKILLIPECKSGLEDDEVQLRLLRQLQSYSSKDFLEIIKKLMPDFDQAEILIVTFQDTAKEIELLIKSHRSELEDALNIVIWSVKQVSKTDQLIVKLFYGTHLDPQLHKTMIQGVLCKPPAREFLSSPDIPDQRFASVLGRRLFVSIVTGLKTLTIQQVLEENPDLAVSLSRLRRILTALFKLVPQLGSFDRRNGTISLKARIDYVLLQDKLLQMGRMTTREYREALGMPPEEKRVPTVEELKPTEQVKLDKFLKS